MKKNIKRNIIISSLLLIMLCITLISGATYALFTSETEVNIAVTSGKVNIEATIEDFKTYSIGLEQTKVDDYKYSFKNGGNVIVEENKLFLNLLTPGDKVTFNIRIKNNSNVIVLYHTIIECINDEGLFDGLLIKVNNNEYNGTKINSSYNKLEVGSDDIIIPVEIEMPLESGNDYADKRCEISYIVEAVQGNALVWDGTIGTMQEPDNDGVYHIKNASELAAFAKSVNEGNNYLNKKVVLDDDIELSNIEWTPIGNSTAPFKGTFDGNNFIINNLKISSGENVGLFGHITLGPENYKPGIQNLTLNNVSIKADNSGAFVGNANTTTRNAGNGGALMLTNLNLTGKVTIEGKNVGGIIGTEWTDFQIASTNITVNVSSDSYVKGTGVIGGVFASTPHGTIVQIKSNINVIVSGEGAAAGGVVGCAGWTLSDVECTGNVIATDIEETANGKYNIGKIVGKEANNPYWNFYSEKTKYGSEFNNFTANNTISITLKNNTTLNNNGITADDKYGTLNEIDYTQNMVGGPIWDWEWSN